MCINWCLNHDFSTQSLAFDIDGFKNEANASLPKVKHVCDLWSNIYFFTLAFCLKFSENILDCLKSDISAILQVQISNHSFTFDHVYGSTGSSSSSIFDECVSPLVDGLFQGYNATVLAYGQVRIFNMAVASPFVGFHWLIMVFGRILKLII